jgi:hypothetical protein
MKNNAEIGQIGELRVFFYKEILTRNSSFFHLVSWHYRPPLQLSWFF